MTRTDKLMAELERVLKNCHGLYPRLPLCESQVSLPLGLRAISTINLAIITLVNIRFYEDGRQLYSWQHKGNTHNWELPLRRYPRELVVHSLPAEMVYDGKEWKWTP